MRKNRILLVDDHALLRLGLTTLLKFHKDLEVVGCAENGTEALQLVRQLKPDVVIMDLVMPGMDGVEATRAIKASAPQTHVLILTSFGTSADVAHAIKAGASGAFMKDTPNEDLVEAIRTVARGETVFSSGIRQAISETPSPVFTEKQLKVLESVTRGLTNPDIARQLGISADTVKQHLNAIFAKLGAANRSEAVAIALKRQLLKI